MWATSCEFDRPLREAAAVTGELLVASVPVIAVTATVHVGFDVAVTYLTSGDLRISTLTVVVGTLSAVYDRIDDEMTRHTDRGTVGAAGTAVRRALWTWMLFGSLLVEAIPYAAVFGVAAVAATRSLAFSQAFGFVARELERAWGGPVRRPPAAQGTSAGRAQDGQAASSGAPPPGSARRGPAARQRRRRAADRRRSGDRPAIRIALPPHQGWSRQSSCGPVLGRCRGAAVSDAG